MSSQRWVDLLGVEVAGGYPTSDAMALLREEALFQRAVQVYDWALPAVALESMRLGCAAAFGGGATTLVRWRRIGPETLAVTANPDVSYAFSWLDLKTDGPTVVDAPAGLQGLLDDAWQRPLTDIGAAGPDRGKGGRFLILPPDFNGEVPDGYFGVPSPTNRVFVFLRGFFDAENPDSGLAQIDQTRIYPLALTDDKPAMRLVDGAGVPVIGLPPTDSTAFEILAGVIDYEPAEAEHMFLRGMAASIGVAQGTPFAPDDELRAVLDAGASVGDKIARATSLGPPEDLRIWPDRRWTSNMVPGPHVVADPQFKTPSYQDVDALLTFFFSAYSTSNAMFLAMPGKGSQYVGAFYDADGDRPMGENTYLLNIPADVPVANYWSIVAYDADTRCLVDNGTDSQSVASNQHLNVNDDGSVDIHLSPARPTDAANWIKTMPGRGFFLALRFYGPTEPFFDRAWTPGDLTKVTA